MAFDRTDVVDRQIWQWTQRFTTSRNVGDCEQCGDRIFHGQYVREVWITTHPKYGDRFLIKRYHDHPECGIYRDE